MVGKVGAACPSLHSWPAMTCLLSLAIVMTNTLQCDKSKPIIIDGAGVSAMQGMMLQAAATYATNRSLMTARNVQATYDVGTFDYGIKRLQGLIPDGRYILLVPIQRNRNHPDMCNGNIQCWLSPFNFSNEIFPGEGFAMFAAGDAFFEGGVNPNPERWLQFHLTTEAIIVYFNLLNTTTLNLSITSLVDIYMGSINYWNDTRIVKQNPGITLPGEKIIVIARKDLNGQTRLFSRLLSIYSPEFKAKYGEFTDPEFPDGRCCNATNWPPGVIDYWAQGATGMAGMAASIPYMIGYGFFVNAAANGIQYATIMNRQGNYVAPTMESLKAASAYWTAQNSDKTEFSILDPNDAKAYPICSFQSIVVDLVSLDNYSCCQQEEFAGLVDFMWYTFNDESAWTYYSTTVEDSFVETMKKTLMPHMNCGGENMYDAYRATLIRSSNLETWQIVLIVLASLLTATLSIVAFALWWRKSVVAERIWLISSKSLDLQQVLTTQSLSSLQHSTASRDRSNDISPQGSKGTLKSTGNRIQFPMIQTTFDEKRVFLQELDCRLPKNWKRETKSLVSRFTMKMTHISITHLYGVCSIGSKVFAIQEYCIKGTLHYVLQTSRFEFTDTIKCSMATDVAEGMAYLHSRGINHGLLNSLTCYVANSWVVKVANWMANSILSRENSTYVDELITMTIDKDELKDEKVLIELIYLHPNLRKSRRFTPICDIYSFGMLLVEILNRKTPFQLEVDAKQTSFYKIVKNKLQLEIVPDPEIASVHPSAILEKMAKSCLIEELSNFESISNELQDQHLQAGGVTEILMEAMEAMIIDMEVKSTELSKVTGKIKDILNQVLPPSVADKFILGQTVEPEYFESVSIFFSDIVGFTSISSRSSPLEVMTFLNDLWLAFDLVIEQFDCYKVDTIGDAYMVCSGLPKRNGIMHLKYICELALALMDRTNNFVVRHLPAEQLRIRIGLNSGPVTAGVIGTKMPQYCVFGDAVNTAQRMESSGVPGKIQVSEVMARLINGNFARFKLTKRGDVDMKGKGTSATYFLEPPPEQTLAPRRVTMAQIPAAVSKPLEADPAGHLPGAVPAPLEPDNATLSNANSSNAVEAS